MHPLLALSIVIREEALLLGHQRWVFGTLLPEAQADLLRDKVAAVGQQLKDQLITLSTAQYQLEAYSVPIPQIRALTAKWSASLKKAPGAAVLVDPTTGAVVTNLTPPRP